MKRRKVAISSLLLQMTDCRSLPRCDSESWPLLVRLLQKHQGVILRSPSGEPHPNPEQSAEKWGLGFEHKKLAPDSYDFLHGRSVARAGLSYEQSSSTVHFGQAAFRCTPQQIDDMAIGLLDLALLLYHGLQPEYAWIDSPDDEFWPSHCALCESRIESLFWANFLGLHSSRNMAVSFCWIRRLGACKNSRTVVSPS